MEFLLKAKPNLNLKINEANTVLHYAIDKGYADIIKLLLEGKASPNLENDNGFTALHAYC